MLNICYSKVAVYVFVYYNIIPVVLVSITFQTPFVPLLVPQFIKECPHSEEHRLSCLT